MGPAIQDVWIVLSGERHHQERQLSEFVEGYEEFHDFDPRQLNWIEALRTLRIMHHARWLAERWSDPVISQGFPVVRSRAFLVRSHSRVARAIGGDE